MIPQTYEDWKNCLVHDCKINLTEDFVRQRLRVYSNKENFETKKFVSLYGQQHVKNIIEWFSLTLKE